jgi:hypothetical protein
MEAPGQGFGQTPHHHFHEGILGDYVTFPEQQPIFYVGDNNNTSQVLSNLTTHTSWPLWKMRQKELP